jgi:hypothetical protein
MLCANGRLRAAKRFPLLSSADGRAKRAPLKKPGAARACAHRAPQGGARRLGAPPQPRDAGGWGPGCPWRRRPPPPRPRPKMAAGAARRSPRAGSVLGGKVLRRPPAAKSTAGGGGPPHANGKLSPRAGGAARAAGWRRHRPRAARDGRRPGRRGASRPAAGRQAPALQMVGRGGRGGRGPRARSAARPRSLRFSRDWRRAGGRKGASLEMGAGVESAARDGGARLPRRRGRPSGRGAGAGRRRGGGGAAGGVQGTAAAAAAAIADTACRRAGRSTPNSCVLSSPHLSERQASL